MRNIYLHYLNDPLSKDAVRGVKITINKIIGLRKTGIMWKINMRRNTNN